MYTFCDTATNYSNLKDNACLSMVLDTPVTTPFNSVGRSTVKVGYIMEILSLTTQRLHMPMSILSGKCLSILAANLFRKLSNKFQQNSLSVIKDVTKRTFWSLFSQTVCIRYECCGIEATGITVSCQIVTEN